MKPIFSFLLTGALLAGAPVMFAQDRFDPSGENTEATLPIIVRTQVEYIVIPTATATQLMYGEKKVRFQGYLDTQLFMYIDVNLNKRKRMYL
jgi:hypothetical protein